MKADARKNSLFHKIALVALFAGLFDFCLGSFLKSQYFKAPVGKLYRVTYSLERTNQDLLIFGSSRAYTHYVPDILERSFGMTSYNVGRDAASILYSTAILRGVLRRYKPKIIILDVRHDDLVRKKQSYDMLSCLLPFYRSHPELRDILNLKSRFERVKLLSRIYPFNSHLLTVLTAGNTEIAAGWADDRGYVPQNGTWSFPIETEDLSIKSEIDEVMVRYYAEFIQLAKRNDIRFFSVISPIYKRLIGRSRSLEIMKKICSNNRTWFFDYSQNPRYLKNASLFKDVNHLNVSGASVFSKELCDRILATNGRDPD